jgi:anti-sigma factor RsiW
VSDGTTHDLHTLTGAYALDALDDDERSAFERHLQACDACAVEVAGLRATSTRLAASAEVVASRAFHDAVMEKVVRTRQLPPDRPADSAPALNGEVVPPARRRPRALLLVAAALVVLAGALGGGLVVEHDRANQLQHRLDTTAQIYAESDARTTTAEGGGGTLTVIASARLGRAVVIPRSMDAGRNRSLQLWVIDHGTFRSAGLLQNDDPALATDLPSGATLGVTSEPRGGSRQPTTTPLVTVDVT